MLELSALQELPVKLLASPRDLALIGLLVTAAAIDWRTYRIPNWLTLGGALLGLVLNGVATELGWLNALAGLGLGLALLLPLWMLRLLGAGDVKLMAMVGAFVGVPGIFGAVLFSLIAGGVAAAGFTLWHHKGLQMLRNVQETVVTSAFILASGHAPSLAAMPSIGKLPYAIGICSGCIAWLLYHHLN